MAIALHVRPGPALTREQFLADHPPFTISLDGYVFGEDRASEPLVRMICQITDLLDMSAGAWRCLTNATCSGRCDGSTSRTRARSSRRSAPRGCAR